jgi:hypothetical protein
MDLCDLSHGGYLGTVIDKAMRYASVELLPRKSDVAAAVHRTLTWCEAQTDVRVQRARYDRRGEYMGGWPSMKSVAFNRNPHQGVAQSTMGLQSATT